MPNMTLPDMMTDEYLTTQVNLLNPIPQKIGRKNLVTFRGIRTTNIAVVLVNRKVQILTAKQLEERGDYLRKKGAQIYRFEAQYYPHRDVVRPVDIQNLKPLPGTDETQIDAVEDVVFDHLDEMTRNYEATYEWILMNMLKGRVMNPGGEVLLDFYNVFGLEKQVVYFDLDNSDSDILAKCEQVRRLIRKGLVGDTSSRVEAQISEEFWDKLVHHPTVVAAYERWEDGRALREGFADLFTFGRMSFEVEEREFEHFDGENYIAKRFIDAEKGIAYPLGTNSTFQAVYCPADMNQWVNTRGQRYYISTKDIDHNKGVDIHMEARPVAWCQRLNALVELDAGAEPAP